MISAWVALCILPFGQAQSKAQTFPRPNQAEYIIKDYTFSDGTKLPEVRMNYRTLGKVKTDEKGVVRNAVLILHGTTGNGGNFINRDFGAELFGKDQPLDADKFFIILPDGLGHGKSCKPSDGLLAKFPRYGYKDMIATQYKLVTEGLKVNHLRLVMGTSMGGMHTWLWGQTYPDFMDALMPLASLPTQISGRNRVWRRMISDSIRNDPEWRGGKYDMQPQSLRMAAQMLFFMSSNPVLRQKESPTRQKADAVLDDFVSRQLRTMDANDVLYAVEASTDYDPGVGLEKIKARLVAINFADDLINPPELGILEKEIKRVPNGKAVTYPLSEQTRGHGSHTVAKIWKSELVDLLKQTETAAK